MEIYERNTWGIAYGMNQPREDAIIAGCHSYMKLLRGRGLSVVKSKLKGHKMFFSLLLYYPSFYGIMCFDSMVAGQ